MLTLSIVALLFLVLLADRLPPAETLPLWASHRNSTPQAQVHQSFHHDTHLRLPAGLLDNQSSSMSVPTGPEVMPVGTDSRGAVLSEQLSNSDTEDVSLPLNDTSSALSLPLSVLSQASSSTSSSANNTSVQAESTARRTRQVSMPRCGVLRGRCRRIRIGACYNMCVNDAFKYVCRVPSGPSGKPRCSVHPYTFG